MLQPPIQKRNLQRRNQAHQSFRICIVNMLPAATLPSAPWFPKRQVFRRTVEALWQKCFCPVQGGKVLNSMAFQVLVWCICALWRAVLQDVLFCDMLTSVVWAEKPEAEAFWDWVGKGGGQEQKEREGEARTGCRQQEQKVANPASNFLVIFPEWSVSRDSPTAAVTWNIC